jgi:hypothetical protein
VAAAVVVARLAAAAAVAVAVAVVVVVVAEVVAEEVTDSTCGNLLLSCPAHLFPLAQGPNELKRR